MVQYDFGLDAYGDLDIEDNDFTYVLSDQQHIQDTIMAFPLWWKQFPADGVGINAYRNSSGRTQQLQGAIKQQLQLDGYSAGNPSVTHDASGAFVIYPNAVRI